MTVVRGDERDNCAKSSRFERDSPHWEGHWVGHLYLPLECSKDEEVVVLGVNVVVVVLSEGGTRGIVAQAAGWQR